MKTKKQIEKEKAIAEVNKKYPLSERLCDNDKMEMRSIALQCIEEEYKEDENNA